MAPDKWCNHSNLYSENLSTCMQAFVSYLRYPWLRSSSQCTSFVSLTATKAILEHFRWLSLLLSKTKQSDWPPASASEEFSSGSMHLLQPIWCSNLRWSSKRWSKRSNPSWKWPGSSQQCILRTHTPWTVQMWAGCRQWSTSCGGNHISARATVSVPFDLLCAHC